MSHEPLSQSIRRITEGEAGDVITLNEIIARTGGRGIHLAIILLCLPFITPIPLPGVSTVFGFVIFLLALRQALGKRARLPRFLGERPIQVKDHQKILKASLRVILFIEKTARPRGKDWLDLRAAQIGNSFLLMFLALLLMLPFPPFVLLTNSLPGLAVIFISASIMEEDGFMIWFGYVLALIATAYITAVIWLILGGAHFFADYLL
ncbi:MAG: exopolysaccharide biosynthesis protein [Verrucomicrobiota bacterium]